MTKATCPECDANVLFSSAPKVSQRVCCAQCRTMLKVISLTPLELDYAFVEPFQEPLHGEERMTPTMDGSG
jgi:lysine biosynthesis protein LysW